MAIAFDAATPTGFGIFGSSTTQAFTVTGSDPYLFVSVGDNNHTGNIISGITYNTVAMGLVGTQNDPNGGHVELWGLVAPATGTHNIVVTYSAWARQAIAVAVSYTGVHQTTPLGTAVTNSGLSTALSATPTLGTNEWAIGVFENNSATGVLTINQGTSRGSTTFHVGIGAADNTSSPVSYTGSPSIEWAAVGVPLKPTSSGTPYTLVLNGGNYVVSGTDLTLTYTPPQFAMRWTR